MKLSYSSAGKTDTGLVRTANEDSMLVDNDRRLWLVADGMGGHANGARASAIAAAMFKDFPLSEEFENAVKATADRMHEANRSIRQEAINSVGEGKMGTTGVALVCRNDQFATLWVGDSRAYIYRRGGLFQLSVDHTHVQELIDQGVLEDSEAEGHPMAHVLSRALGVAEDVRVDIVQDYLEAGDRFLLCSDGLTGPVGNSRLRAILAAGTPQECASALVAAAHEAGAPDNVTAIVVNVMEDAR